MTVTIPTRSQRPAADRILSRCREIAACTEVPGQITRTFLSPAMRRVHTLLRDWMDAAGMTVRIDAAGNLRGVLPGPTPQAPRLIIGSHLDTIPNAGPYDGALGVVLGLAVAEELRGQNLPFSIEVIGFSAEEGVRFSKPFLGSLALIGELDAETLALPDRNGVTVAEAIRIFGLNLAELPNAELATGSFAYLEVHIEQGPVLESESLPLGIVEAIAGQTRTAFIFEGQANHAGATPMHLRHDALSAAAEWIAEVEAYAASREGLLATVDTIEAHPGATNIIPARVTATLDLRHANDDTRATAINNLTTTAKLSAAKRGVKLTTQTQLDQPAVPMDRHLTRLLESAATTAKAPHKKMTSGAGHDAMIVARRLPAAMLFLRSPEGISHHPNERVHPPDIEAALTTTLEFLKLLSNDEAIPKPTA
ncbi:Zn-dependent hydrolase [Edaphobacter acidisoli]|uniref:Zn-dependent hydrolase n=1 Tax=Edaphobacter acidisoli TaxID=2040573 RepID=A0A916RNJ3_9BACT|nr:allantoate amidohydrolase [Edaphobacter acidisoli]GGA63129.1 Zn-dependent hydrolase [Edaphobacter acidisoli]